MLKIRVSSLICFGFLFLHSCNYSDVEVKSIQKVKIHNLDKEGINLTADLHVVNPNNYPVKISSTDANLYLDGVYAGKAQLNEKVEIPSNHDSLVSVAVRTDFEGGSLQLIPIILGVAVKGKVDLRAKGSLRASTFLIGKRFTFDYAHKAEF